MPTYDYECRSCGHNFETFQSMSDNPLATCPECKKNELRRLIGGGLGIIFKGSGFYVNDSRQGGGHSSAGSSPASASSTGTSGTDSKSDGTSSTGTSPAGASPAGASGSSSGSSNTSSEKGKVSA